MNLSYSVLGNILSLVVACMETCSTCNGAMWVGCVYIAGQLKTSALDAECNYSTNHKGCQFI